MSLFESFISALNYALNLYKIKTIDFGGANFVYTFGGFFGMAVAAVLFCGQGDKVSNCRRRHYAGSYRSYVLGFIGVIFIWIFFPIANSALMTGSARFISRAGDEQGDLYPLRAIIKACRYRTIINSYLAMLGSAFSGYVVSAILNGNRFTIEHVLKASIAGGVMISSVAPLIPYPFISAIIGILGGGLAVLFLWKFREFWEFHSLYDTFGQINVFAFPGFFGGVATTIAAGVMAKKEWGDDEPFRGTFFTTGKDRGSQAALQIAATFISLAMAFLAGAIVGIIVKVLPLGDLKKFYVDSENFEEDEEAFPEYQKVSMAPNYFNRIRDMETEVKPVRTPYQD